MRDRLLHLHRRKLNANDAAASMASARWRRSFCRLRHHQCCGVLFSKGTTVSNQLQSLVLCFCWSIQRLPPATRVKLSAYIMPSTCSNGRPIQYPTITIIPILILTAMCSTSTYLTAMSIESMHSLRRCRAAFSATITPTVSTSAPSLLLWFTQRRVGRAADRKIPHTRP